MPRTIYTASAAKLVTRIVADILDVAITFKQALGNRNGKAVAVCAACSCGTPAFPHCRQWGHATGLISDTAVYGGAYPASVTYPIAFKTASIGLVNRWSYKATTGTATVISSSTTALAARFVTSGNTSDYGNEFAWIAIGY